MRTVVLGGPPGVGKSTVGRLTAARRQRCAFIDVDDIRQLVVAGAAAPWDGPEGQAQQRLGAVNACMLANSFVENTFDVLIVDVLTAETLLVYRTRLDRPLIVQLTVQYAEACRRASTRQVYLTPDEFQMLHAQQAEFAGDDVTLDITQPTAHETATRIADLTR